MFEKVMILPPSHLLTFPPGLLIDREQRKENVGSIYSPSSKQRVIQPNRE